MEEICKLLNMNKGGEVLLLKKIIQKLSKLKGDFFNSLRHRNNYFSNIDEFKLFNK